MIKFLTDENFDGRIVPSDATIPNSTFSEFRMPDSELFMTA